MCWGVGEVRGDVGKSGNLKSCFSCFSVGNVNF